MISNRNRQLEITRRLDPEEFIETVHKIVTARGWLESEGARIPGTEIEEIEEDGRIVLVNTPERYQVLRAQSKLGIILMPTEAHAGRLKETKAVCSETGCHRRAAGPNGLCWVCWLRKQRRAA